ncbi:MAG: type IV pilus assembly protein FimV, partial [Pseudomonadales bacterium]
MVRKQVQIIGLLSVMYAASIQALGLGDIKLFSALNEPLDAEIKLLNVGDLNENQILIKLASPEDFKRAGVDREFFLTNLRYEAKLDGRGAGVIKIKTKDLVREPYLNFLIETKWPTGKLVREYTLLLDLPAFSPNSEPVRATAPVPTQKPTQQTATESTALGATPAPRPKASQSKPTPTFSAPQTPSQPQTNSNTVAPSQSSQSGTVTTQRNDTLWKIASKVRPVEDVTVKQTTVALQELNPNAFIKNNINLLKTGQVMR